MAGDLSDSLIMFKKFNLDVTVFSSNCLQGAVDSTGAKQVSPFLLINWDNTIC